MGKFLTILGASIIAFLGFLSSGYPEEQITITTYYPSPYGSYRELGWGNYPNTRGKLSSDQGSSIELGGSGTPYIDFSNDMTSDADARVILTGNDTLSIEGITTLNVGNGQGDLVVLSSDGSDLNFTANRVSFKNNDGTPATIRAREVIYCVNY